jgi:5-methylcytosine-specific restriction endonuclease McrA
MAQVQCINCNREFKVIPARLPTAKFCSYACRGQWRSKNWTGANHPRFWQDAPRVRNCLQCGAEFSIGETEAISGFSKRKFCSKECSKHGQKYRSGEEHPLFNPNSRRKDRRGKHGAWARAVISRDKATCQRCGAQGIELQAHHILSFKEHPEKRWELANGETLCHRCHWTEHSASTANGVNSGNILPGNAGDNPEPSFERKFIEGVTTRGRAYRRWDGECEWCGKFISKRWSDTKGKAHLFCSSVCSGKFIAAHRTWRTWKNAPKAHGSNASTSAPLERDEIV